MTKEHDITPPALLPQDILRLCLLLVVLSFALFAWAALERTHQPIPRPYAITQGGPPILLQPLSAPNLTTKAVLQWSAQAATAIYNFDFFNYSKVMKANRGYFTEVGYQHFLDAFNASKILQTVRAKRLVVSGVVIDTPVILKEGVITTGFYAWQVQLPMLLTYQSSSEQMEQNIVISFLISKVPTSESAKGIKITSFNVNAK